MSRSGPLKLLAALAVVTALAGCSMGPRERSDTTHVLIAGDSLAAGYYSTSEQSSYRALVVASLAPTIEATTAIGGATLGQVADRTDFPANLDVAIIELGTNDVGRTALPEFGEQYSQLLTRLRAASPDATLVCLGTWRTLGSAEYDSLIERSCESADGEYVDLAPIFAADDTRGATASWRGTPDNYHPNDLGHRMIADAIIAALG